MDNTFIHGLPDDIVQRPIIPKLMESILAVKPLVIDISGMDDVICDFMVLLCIHKYMEVDKVWHLHFGMGEVHNTF